MVPVLALFLVALVGLPVAQALDCHVCAYNGENCFNPMRCPAMVTYCMTTRTYYTPTRMKPPPLSQDGGVGTVCCLWGIFSWPVNTDVKGTSASALCGSKHCKTTLQGRSRYHAPFTDEETEAQIWKQPACLRSGCLTVWRHLHGLLCCPSAWNTAAAPVQTDVRRGGWTAASHLPL
ncbi:ly-6/neurotoxin-like protein 1 isoform X2 [Neophocaena asiaeorientalis asiaeorientalis]|uniref:Ly-6/neurotoxin-like protein 1 isoform X2 n=1 Tax=Neophocaena asiaeorientalis asiaeorientalis TaxID=1706337 RepID=A0A341B4I9_NEOAA|nr:ly-6/neurotoxin-like protein 1 isoform X2 [Neophocaena asiaeorientalis asiaeorientalis]